MKKRSYFKKYLLLVLCLGLFVFILDGCSSDAQNDIVGRWEGESNGYFRSLEFFSDGTYASSHPNYSGRYTIDGNRIKLDGYIAEPLIYSFTISNQTLTLTDDNGRSSKYYRVGMSGASGTGSTNNANYGFYKGFS